MTPLICYKNLSVPEGAELEPWQWDPPDGALETTRAMSKDLRRRTLLDPKTDWNCYSIAQGVNKFQRVDDKVNPIVSLRAFAVDYDMVASIDTVGGYLKQLPATLQPSYAERSLGGKWRLVWLFEEPVHCLDSAFALEFMSALSKTLNAPTILAGFDLASLKPTQVWTNGGEWYEVAAKPLTKDFLTGVAIKILEAQNKGHIDIPIEIIAAKVQEKFPGRWAGEFTLGVSGVRFWDPKANNVKGAYVCRNGCYCFTGLQPFVSWAEIFGARWVEEQRVVHLGQSASGVFFDGKLYWTEVAPGSWVRNSREDTLLHLAARGLSRKAGKALVSDAEKVLKHIQDVNRVSGAVPVVYQKAGVINLNGMRILNTSSVRALEPAPGPANIANFPFIYEFVHGHFERGEFLSVEHFLAWLKRSYIGALELKPVVGQALFLCGPKANGKTLMCMRIIAPLLGNRTANPYDYLAKVTTFNSEIFSSGLLAINDEVAPTSESEREKFMQGIKSFVVNTRHQFHPKFCDRVEIEWLGRLVITLNDDPKSVGILPELNDNTKDKMMFFATKGYGKDWPDKYTLEETITRELPHFARWLLEWQPPAEVLEPGTRAVVRSFHDPKIIEIAKQQESSFNLLELIQTWQESGAYWNDDKPQTEWIGTPTDLLTQLSDQHRNSAVLKDWNVRLVAKHLQGLVRSGDKTGIEVVGVSGHRKFKITKGGSHDLPK